MERTPAEAWALVQQLVADRRRGDVIKHDRRAHEVLRLLGGQDAYNAVASAPERIGPKFLESYQLLSEIDTRMRRLADIVGVRTPGAR